MFVPFFGDDLVVVAILISWAWSTPSTMNSKTMIAMGSVAAIAMLVATAVLPLGAQQALAYKHHHHHHGISIKIHQSINQENECSEANCQNAAANVVGNSGGVNVQNIH
jgi:hypothetical protein